MWFLLCKILHVIGNVLWLGGGAAAAFAFASLASESKEIRVAGARALRKIVLLVVTPGMVLSMVAGLTMLIGFWSELYAKAPWAHTKLTVGLIAAGFSGVLTGRLRRAADGADVKLGPVRLAGAILVLSAIAGVTLVMTKLGSH